MKYFTKLNSADYKIIDEYIKINNITQKEYGHTLSFKRFLKFYKKEVYKNYKREIFDPEKILEERRKERAEQKKNNIQDVGDLMIFTIGVVMLLLGIGTLFKTYYLLGIVFSVIGLFIMVHR